jgi:hypothetical protein
MRKGTRPEVQMIRHFDHVRSERVDVRPNAEGEFVQVWNDSFDSEKRRLLLTYRRTPTGVVDISSDIHLDEGPWFLIQTTGPQRWFYHRTQEDRTRYEEILPSGRVAVDDPLVGLTIQRKYSEAFDWNNKRPSGRELSDRATIKRQTEDLPWFVSTYQEHRHGEELMDRQLLMVVEHKGRVLIRTHEF